MVDFARQNSADVLLLEREKSFWSFGILEFFVQDGAEYGSRVVSSRKTLQFFVCFISFFVVLRIRCCEYNCLR